MLVSIGRTRGQRVRSTVDVGVFVLVKVADALDHLARLVRGGSVVQPHQLFAVDALLQNRKIAPHRLHVKGRMAIGLRMWRLGSLAMPMRFGRRDKAARQAHCIDKIELRCSRCG